LFHFVAAKKATTGKLTSFFLFVLLQHNEEGDIFLFLCCNIKGNGNNVTIAFFFVFLQRKKEGLGLGSLMVVLLSSPSTFVLFQ
jgi:hypothetical protein